MSATNRGGKRSAADFYATPEWCVRRLMEHLDLPGGRWLEPAAGNGAIIRSVQRKDLDWTAWELRQEEAQALQALVPRQRLYVGDFLEACASGHLDRERYAVGITNPPFRLAQDFIEASMSCCDTVVMLLRLNYLASKSRWDFMSKNTPDVYVLPSRPSFTGAGTDSIEYAWFVWRHRHRSEGKLRVLGLK